MKKIVSLTLVFLLYIVTTPQILVSGEPEIDNPNQDWITFQGDFQNTGLVCENSLPYTKEPQILWTKEIRAGIEGRRFTTSPVVANGKVFIGGFDEMAHKTFESFFFCLDAETGEEIWRVKLDEPVERDPEKKPKNENEDGPDRWFLQNIDSTPIIFGDSILVVTVSGCVYRISQENGDFVWENKISLSSLKEGKSVVSEKSYLRNHSSAVISQGYLFIPMYYQYVELCKDGDCNDKMVEVDKANVLLFKLNLTTGDIKKQYVACKAYSVNNHNKCRIEIAPFEEGMRSNLACINEKILLVAVARMYCIDSEKMEVVWDAVVSSRYPYRSSPAIYGNKIYFGNHDRDFYGLDLASGNHIFISPLKQSVRCITTPVISEDFAFFPSINKDFICYDLSEKEIAWRKDFKDVTKCPAIVADTKVLVVGDGRLYCLKRTNGQEVWSVEIGSASLGMAVVNGKIYIGTLEGKMHCIGERFDSISLESPSKKLKIGERIKLTATGTYQKDESKSHFRIKSVEPNKLCVNGDYITGAGIGFVKVTAQNGTALSTIELELTR
ncbi:MAG TPA: PQQ-binding-like beta-propeller repeat protein [Caldisericia bacterium]|nr:PQQ-binding-like beta-propeller repeat protein [Caldisericia bacterium]HPF49422.1 PQQ-binding-like beta-propeller repeat protein [Caldisericia bacterium]HPI84375.1 PQQ-binding-like beta-propeller repeat protein [Caldisericia bacterium]HPQ93593.1 PQQ-binding-like beta-propeller repeat protein [Caldisericia bacterium]HRV75562.1 PQQ-binding-like beta-propeller repeat protein [Caldisericia bacterium]